MRIEFHPAALDELVASARFYENRLRRLGYDFTSEVNRALDRLGENPGIGAAIEGPYRRLLLGWVPFSVIYRVKASTLRILAIAHQRRLPGYWKGRD